MQIIYIHGLNSSHLATKGMMLKQFCEKNFPEINVQCPNLNHSPVKVMEILNDLIAKDPDTGLVGSSLGGFFATILANQTGCKTVLINPSTNPANSLQRFFQGGFDDVADDTVLHTTRTGWQVTKADMLWLKNNRPASAKFADRLLVLLKTGDETLDYRLAVEYFSQHGKQSHLVIEEGGDHSMTDFDTKLSQVVQFLFGKVIS